MTSRRRIMMNRLLVTSPWLTLVLLIAMSQAFPNRVEIGGEAEDRKAQVALAMESVPWVIGRWVGEDATDQVPREAQKLLKPNAILSRLYRSPGGPPVHVMVVHCSDARDMIGHYPPVCYPSSGWIPVPLPEVGSDRPEAPQDSGQGTQASELRTQDLFIDLHGQKLPVRQYVFRLMLDRRRENIIRIFNAFVLPDGTFTRRIDDINRQSERLAVSVQGVAQLQVITPASVPIAEAVNSVEEVLQGMTPMFQALGVGGGLGGGAEESVDQRSEVSVGRVSAEGESES